MINDFDSSSPTVFTTEYGIPIRNIWYMLVYVWGERPDSPFWQKFDVEASPTLDALLALMLVKLVQQRMRIGLGRSYVPGSQTQRRIRGRIDFTRSLKQRAFEKGQAVCEFEHFSINEPRNKIIRTTLFQLIQTGQFGLDPKKAEAIRHSIRSSFYFFEGVDLVELTPDFVRRERAKRHDRDYRVILAICDLILQKQLPHDQRGDMSMAQLDHDHYVFYRLYERFIKNFYEFHLQNWTVSPQKKHVWHENSPNNYLPIMKPDLLLEEKFLKRRIILDTKFTRRSLVKNQWKTETFNSSHLYQMYAYLRTQEHISEHHRQAIGILLYPEVRKELSETIELGQQQIRIETVNLAAPWQEIEQRLIDLILN